MQLNLQASSHIRATASRRIGQGRPGKAGRLRATALRMSRSRCSGSSIWTWRCCAAPRCLRQKCLTAHPQTRSWCPRPRRCAGTTSTPGWTVPESAGPSLNTGWPRQVGPRGRFRLFCSGLVSLHIGHFIRYSQSICIRLGCCDFGGYVQATPRVYSNAKFQVYVTPWQVMTESWDSWTVNSGSQCAETRFCLHFTKQCFQHQELNWIHMILLSPKNGEFPDIRKPQQWLISSKGVSVYCFYFPTCFSTLTYTCS